MATIEQAQAQVAQQEAILAQRKREASEQEKQIEARKQQVAVTRTQEALRQQTGIEGTRQRKAAAIVERQVGQAQEEIQQSKEEISQAESQVGLVKKEIEVAIERKEAAEIDKAAFERAKKLYEARIPYSVIDDKQVRHYLREFYEEEAGIKTSYRRLYQDIEPTTITTQEISPVYLPSPINIKGSVIDAVGGLTTIKPFGVIGDIYSKFSGKEVPKSNIIDISKVIVKEVPKVPIAIPIIDIPSRTGKLGVGAELTTLGKAGKDIFTASTVAGVKLGETKYPFTNTKLKDIPTTSVTKEGIARFGYNFIPLTRIGIKRSEFEKSVEGKPSFKLTTISGLAKDVESGLTFTGNVAASGYESTPFTSKYLAPVARQAPSVAFWIGAAPVAAGVSIGAGIEELRPEYAQEQKKRLYGQYVQDVRAGTITFNPEERALTKQEFFASPEIESQLQTNIQSSAKRKIGFGAIVAIGLGAGKIIKFLEEPRVEIIKGRVKEFPYQEYKVGKTNVYKQYVQVEPTKFVRTTRFRSLANWKPLETKFLNKGQIYVKYAKGTIGKPYTLEIRKVSKAPNELFTTQEQIDKFAKAGKFTRTIRTYEVTPKSTKLPALVDNPKYFFQNVKVQRDITKYMEGKNIVGYSGKFRLANPPTKTVESIGITSERKFPQINPRRQVYTFKGFNFPIGKSTKVYTGTLVEEVTPQEQTVRFIKTGGRKSSAAFLEQLYKTEEVVSQKTLSKPFIPTKSIVQTTKLPSAEAIIKQYPSMVGGQGIVVTDYSKYIGGASEFYNPQQTIVYPTALKEVQETRLDVGIGTGGGAGTIDITKTIDKPTTIIKQDITPIEKQIPLEKPVTIPKEIQVATQIPQTQSRSLLKQFQSAAQRTNLLQRPKTPSKSPSPFAALKDIAKILGLQRRGKKSDYDVFVRKAGKDIEIASNFRTQAKAEKALTKALKGSLRASGYITSSGKKIPFTELNLGGEFTQSKIEPFRAVQRKSKRLGTFPEVKEIQLFRRKK